jgi:hypothetical protein
LLLTCSVQEPVELAVEEDAFGSEHDEVDEQTVSTSSAEVSLPPSEDSEQMNGQEVEDDDGLGLVQSDTPLGVADDHNIQSTSSLTAFSVSQLGRVHKHCYFVSLLPRCLKFYFLPFISVCIFQMKCLYIVQINC